MVTQSYTHHQSVQLNDLMDPKCEEHKDGWDHGDTWETCPPGEAALLLPLPPSGLYPQMWVRGQHLPTGSFPHRGTRRERNKGVRKAAVRRPPDPSATLSHSFRCPPCPFLLWF